MSALSPHYISCYKYLHSNLSDKFRIQITKCTYAICHNLLRLDRLYKYKYTISYKSLALG
jgi:hypothetical protein